MAKPGASLKSSLRKSLIGAYRTRGRGKNNLWLVSSVKTGTEWILPSDRQFVHWIAYLETNPDVSEFDLAPDRILSHDGLEQRATELDAVVTFRNQVVEWHEVKAGRNKNNPKHQSQFKAQAAAADNAHAIYRIFNDSELKPKVKLATRWLKPLAYANTISGQEHSHCQTVLAVYLKQQGSGNIGQILEALQDHDPAIVLGLISRMAIQGMVIIDLLKISFGLLTPWKYHG